MLKWFFLSFSLWWFLLELSELDLLVMHSVGVEPMGEHFMDHRLMVLAN